MSNEELDQLDKAYEEMKRVKATKATRQWKKVSKLHLPVLQSPGAATPVVGKGPDTTKSWQALEARQG